MKRIRIWGLVLLCLLVIMPSLGLAAIPSSPYPAFFVNDFANVISDEDEAAMVALGEALEDRTDAQVVAVTVNFLDGMDIETYATELYNTWGIGQKDVGDGVLLLLSVGDRTVHTTVGTDFESKLPASVTGAITDDYIDYFAENDFSGGMRANYTALINKVASMYGVSNLTSTASQQSNVPAPAPAQNNTYYEPQPTSSGGIGGFMGLLIGIIVIVVIFSIVRSLLRSAGNASGCLFGWMLGRGSRPRRRTFWAPPPPRPPMGGGPRPPRSRPSGGRSTGSFGGGGFSGGGGSSRGFGGGSSRPRSGGGGSTRGGGSSRKF